MTTLYRIVFRLSMVLSIVAGAALAAVVLAGGNSEGVLTVALFVGAPAVALWALTWVLKPADEIHYK
jgi:hypothetical protein